MLNESPSFSTRIRHNSGTETTGCVSLSWIAYSLDNLEKSLPYLALYFLRISWRDALEKKYCCFNLNFLPASVESFGYNTAVIASASFFSLNALSYFWSLNKAKLNSSIGSACHNLNVLILAAP